MCTACRIHSPLGLSGPFTWLSQLHVRARTRREPMTHVGVQLCEEWFEGHKISKINKARLHTPVRRRCNLPPAAGGGRSNDNHNTRGCLPQTIAHTEGVCPPCTRNYDSTTQQFLSFHSHVVQLP